MQNNKAQETDFEILKSSGERAKFSLSKLRGSLVKSGADNKLVDQILNTVRDELYQGISTKEIYNRAFSILKKEKSVFASKYKLKKAIYELGPTGFPFENFVAAILKYSGYEVEVGVIKHGKCVSHEVDVVARKNNHLIMVECKFHSDESKKCDVKIPLYINSRYNDILAKESQDNLPKEGWVATNTRFTNDAIQYGKCSGLYLLGWNYPNKEGLKDRIDRLSLYPITVSTILSSKEKEFLLNRNIVLCRELAEQSFFLDYLDISDTRKERILNEIHQICTI